MTKRETILADEFLKSIERVCPEFLAGDPSEASPVVKALAVTLAGTLMLAMEQGGEPASRAIQQAFHDHAKSHMSALHDKKRTSNIHQTPRGKQ